MKLYNIFIKAAASRKGISYRDAQTRFGSLYKKFKKGVEKRYSAKQIESWLSGWDFKSKDGKVKRFVSNWVGRALKLETEQKPKGKLKGKPKEKPRSKKIENKLLRAFLENQEYLDDALFDYLERYVFVEEDTREEICSNLSSIIKACIEYVSRVAQGVVIEAESLQFVEVRGLNFLFKTFLGISDRISYSKDFFHAVESLLTFVAYNPAIYIEFTESEDGFVFEYAYGRDDEAFVRQLREEDFEIFQNAKI